MKTQPALDLRQELEQTWQREIPLAAAMGLSVREWRGGALEIRAEFEKNRNLHGTAFAGSLYSVCVLAGWGAAWLTLRDAGLDATIVVRDAQIKYRFPVKHEIVCRCAVDPASAREALGALAENGRCSLGLQSRVIAGNRSAVRFSATYAITR